MACSSSFWSGDLSRLEFEISDCSLNILRVRGGFQLLKIRTRNSGLQAIKRDSVQITRDYKRLHEILFGGIHPIK